MRQIAGAMTRSATANGGLSSVGMRWPIGRLPRRILRPVLDKIDRIAAGGNDTERVSAGRALEPSQFVIRDDRENMREPQFIAAAQTCRAFAACKYRRAIRSRPEALADQALHEAG